MLRSVWSQRCCRRRCSRFIWLVGSTEGHPPSSPLLPINGRLDFHASDPPSPPLTPPHPSGAVNPKHQRKSLVMRGGRLARSAWRTSTWESDDGPRDQDCPPEGRPDPGPMGTPHKPPGNCVTAGGETPSCPHTSSSGLKPYQYDVKQDRWRNTNMKHFLFTGYWLSLIFEPLRYPLSLYQNIEWYQI